jgi:hypothetical protein
MNSYGSWEIASVEVEEELESTSEDKPKTLISNDINVLKEAAKDTALAAKELEDYARTV